MLLNQVAQSTTVDAGRRRAAADKLKEVDYLGTDIHELPRAAKDPAEKEKERELAREVTAQAPSKAARPVLAADPWSGTSGGGKTAESAAESGGKTTDLALQGRDGEAKARAALEPRVFGGRASADEIRMLKAICKHQGDRACSDRAAALLANQK
jgi:hypothetical protein